MKSIIKLLGTCPNYSNKSIDIKCDQSQKKGLSFLLNFVCDSEICDWSQSFYTSKRLNQTPGCDNQSFEINNRAIITTREIGRGHTALIFFLWLYEYATTYTNQIIFNEMQQNIASV